MGALSVTSPRIRALAPDLFELALDFLLQLCLPGFMPFNPVLDQRLIRGRIVEFKPGRKISVKIVDFLIDLSKLFDEREQFLMFLILIYEGTVDWTNFDAGRTAVLFRDRFVFVVSSFCAVRFGGNRFTLRSIIRFRGWWGGGGSRWGWFFILFVLFYFCSRYLLLVTNLVLYCIFVSAVRELIRSKTRIHPEAELPWVL